VTETWFVHLLFSKEFLDLQYKFIKRNGEMSVSGQVMVEMFANHLPFILSL
jgi:hypothetical protein